MAKKKRPKKTQEEREQEMNKLLEDLGIDRATIEEFQKESQKGQVGIALTSQLVTNRWLNYLLYFVINSLIMLALLGYIPAFTNEAWWQLPIFFLIFTTFEIILKYFQFRFLISWIFKTLGLFLLIPLILALAAAYWLTPGISTLKMGNFIAFGILFALVRFAISQYIVRLTKRKLFKS